MANREKVMHKAIITSTTPKKIIDTTMEQLDQKNCMEMDANQSRGFKNPKMLELVETREKRAVLYKAYKKYLKTFGWEF